MRVLLLTSILTLIAFAAFAEPVLLLIDAKDFPATDQRFALLRQSGDVVFVTAELSAVNMSGVSAVVLSPDYQPGMYYLIPIHEAENRGLPILWRDSRRALVKLSIPPAQWQEWWEPLETSPLPANESRRPSSLDDPVLDPWLAVLFNQTSGDSLFSYVTTLSSFNRYTRWPSCDSAAYWIRNKFLSWGYDSVYFHSFTASGSGWSRTALNVIAVLPGTEQPDSIVVVGGHLDATSENVSVGAPGADDNASGTAGVMEAARLLRPYQFRRTLMFCGFSGEEQGLQGSAALAQLMSTQGRRVLAMLNMDMISYYEAGGADVWIEGFYQGTSSVWLMEVLRDNFLQYSTLIPEIYGAEGFGSDHVSFHNRNYPAVLSIEYEYQSNACYHRLCDLPNRVNVPFLRQIAATNIVTAAELASPVATGSISGMVTLEGTADYSQVRVTVVGASAPADTTLVSGFYQVQGLMPGTFALAFQRLGWITDTLTGIVVTQGNETANQNIFLAASPAGSVAGTITLAGGGGLLTDAIVSVDNAAVRVNADGTYLLTPVYAGQWPVTAALTNYALASQVVTLAGGQNLTGVNLTLYPLWDLEASNFGLISNGTGWQWGTDATVGARSGTRVWGTVLNGNYANCTDYQLEMPPVCLANLDSARLTLWHWYDIEPNGPTVDYDGANVSVAVFGTDDWEVIPPQTGYPGGAGYNCNPIQNEPAYAGNSGGWVSVSFNLQAFLGQSIRLRFRLGTDVGVTRRGWYLDDIALRGVPRLPPETVHDLTIYPESGNLRLHWSTATGATHYRIYRGVSSDQPVEQMTLLGTVTSPTYLDSSAEALLRAFYVVVAQR